MPDFLYCLNSSTIRPTPILDKIRIAGETGYSAIELWHDDIDAHLATRRQSWPISARPSSITGSPCRRRFTSKAGSRRPAPNTSASSRSASGGCTRPAELGAIHIIAGPPAGSADHDQGARNYRELLEIGRQIGVKPAMEYLGFVEDINTIEAAAEIVTKSEPPRRDDRPRSVPHLPRRRIVRVADETAGRADRHLPLQRYARPARPAPSSTTKTA